MDTTFALPREALESRELLLSVFDVAPYALSVFSAIYNPKGEIEDFEILMQNHIAYQITGLKPEDLTGKRYSQVFPKTIETGLLDKLKQVVRTGEAADFEQWYDGEGLRHWFRIKANKLGHLLVIATEDITERKNAEQQIREKNHLLEAILNAPNMGVTVYEAVRNGQGDIIDFRFVLLNKATIELWGGRDLTGKRLLEEFPGNAQLMQDYRRVVETGNMNVHEIRYQHEGFNNWFSISESKFGDGLVIKWEDITEKKNAEQELLCMKDLLAERATDKYLVLFNNMEQGFCIIEMIFDEAQEPVDYRFMEVNPVFEKQTGLKDALGKTMRQLVPAHEESWFRIYGQVAKTGRSIHFENQAAHLSDGIWYDVYAFPFGQAQNHQVAVLFNDITEKKKAEQQLKDFNALLEQQVSERTSALKESTERFQAAINVSPVVLSILKNIRNEQQEIVDFHFEWVSKSGEAMAGKDVTGLRLTEQFPYLRKIGVFDKFVYTAERGEPTDFEYYYHADGLYLWKRWKAVRLVDGLFVSVEDITERKKAEEEITKNLTLLRQSEEVAKTGSWEYDPTTGLFNWSEGMYRLFGLPEGSPVSPETYLDYVIEEDLPIARKIIYQLRESHEPMEETLRLQVNGQVLTFRIKAVVLRNEQGHPVKMLGVDLDISEVKRLEEENLQMRLNQQKALLLAILEAQEEERRRISESLHNGVGQILYATKLNLDQVAQLVPKQAVQATEKLLSDAINETRRVSHELVPFVLKDFGLEEAILDLCRKYNGSTLRLNCQVEGLQGPLEPYLEIAIYRISLELVNNIVKHAQATEATLHLSRRRDRILLQVQDNGKGITKEEALKTKGIGLRTTRDRVKLLNGTLAITTLKTGKGTLVTIRIPVQE